MDFVSQNLSPISDRVFIFYGVKNDGTKIYEYDNSQHETPFPELKKQEKNIKEFGLLGCGGKIYLDVNTGVFHLDGSQTLSLGLQTDGRIFGFENDKKDIDDYDFHDLIQLKKACSDVISVGGISNGMDMPMSITEHLIGYHIKVDIDDNQYYICEVCFVLPLTGPYRVQFRITPFINEDKQTINLMYKRNNNIQAQAVEVKNKDVNIFEMVI